MATVTQTPLMKQYAEMKKKHPDAVLLFRIGDFYECFKEDAVIASDILGITLTTRRGAKEPIHLAGFPDHTLDTYLPKLIRAGKRVAICEQLEDPKVKTVLKKRNEVEHIFPGIPKAPISKPKLSTESISLLISLFSAFHEILNKLYIFEEIRRKTLELRSLSKSLGISPIKAFNECNVDNIVQPSLFD